MRTLHGGAERLLRHILDRLIDREYDCLTRLRRDLHTLVRLAFRIAFEEQTSGLAGDLRVVKLFDAAETLAVEADVTKDVRRQRTVRVVAFRLQPRLKSGKFECRDLRGFV